MAGWMKLLLGVVLTLGVFGGVAALVYDLHPMRSHYSMSNEGCDADIGPGSEGRIDCFDRYRREMDSSDRNDFWAAIAAGAGAAGLFWLLVNLFYIRPRRRRVEGARP